MSAVGNGIATSTVNERNGGSVGYRKSQAGDCERRRRTTRRTYQRPEKSRERKRDDFKKVMEVRSRWDGGKLGGGDFGECFLEEISLRELRIVLVVDTLNKIR